jgi:hypothetical protein
VIFRKSNAKRARSAISLRLMSIDVLEAVNTALEALDDVVFFGPQLDASLTNRDRKSGFRGRVSPTLTSD